MTCHDSSGSHYTSGLMMQNDFMESKKKKRKRKGALPMVNLLLLMTKVSLVDMHTKKKF